MGRHRLHAARTTATPRHAAHRGPASRRRITAPVAMATALLVGAPAGTALADTRPPPAVDGLGSALGTLLGTDRPARSRSDRPVTGDDIAGTAAPAVSDTASTPVDGAPAKRSDATRVTLLPKNGSGVTGSAKVDSARVVARASGLDPEARYVSFFYGATSSATNNNPCILDGTNPLPADQTIGEWKVDEFGNGTLSAPNPLGARYTLQAGAMSIRKVEHDFSKATALPVSPVSYSLVACGEVRRIAVLDPVTTMVPKLPKLPTVPLVG